MFFSCTNQWKQGTDVLFNERNACASSERAVPLCALLKAMCAASSSGYPLLVVVTTQRPTDAIDCSLQKSFFF